MICIDFFSTVKIMDGIAKYTGGSNYALNIINVLAKSERYNEHIAILMPKGLRHDFPANCSILEVDSILSYDYSNARLLFLPQVNGTVLSKVGEIKHNYPKLLIYGTLHDRQHNCFKYDYYNRFYFDNGIDAFIDWLKFRTKKIYFDVNYQKWIKNFDKVFTVSNQSMQLLYCKNIPYISYFIQDSFFSASSVAVKPREEFALMVSAGRTEKNALRTIEAFCKFHEDYQESKLRLYLTGISDNIIERFLKTQKFDIDIFKEYVRCFGYVSNNELDQLYREASFVVFTSKAEGFGLPVLEAIKNNKAVLASMVSSIPEVAGCSVLYVDPYSVESIKNGFCKMSNDSIRKKYEFFVGEKRKIIEEQIKLDKQIFIEEIFDVW